MARHDPFLLHECFARQARRTPGQVALYYEDESVTFAELEAASHRVAAHLRSRGIGPGCYVGLHLERSIDYVAALLGVLESNAAVVPLPPSYPEGRLREILSFAGLDAVVDDDATPLDPALSDRVVHFGDLAKPAGPADSAADGDPSQAAFVLCSSGSTGKPKMIVRGHRSFFHRLQWTWEKHPYLPGEVCCQKSYMTTTHAIYELFEPLLAGTPVVIVPDRDVRDLERFWETIRTRAVSRLLIVPSLLQASLDMPGFVAPPVRVLVLMGEYVHPGLAARALEFFPEPARVFSIYGSTEASSTLVCDLRASYRAGEELPLGEPISPDVRASVLDAGLEQVAPGEAGMLHIAGSALFEGYFKDPALTASVLVEAPAGGAAAGRLYDTRDQVRRLPDGSLRFMGRVDHTVKIRGFRVDLDEVERVLLLQPDVRQGVVLLGGADPAASMLLAFVTPDTVDQASVYQALREQLPAYMVPSVIVALPSFPLTASGKVDRRKLLEQYAGRAAGPPAGGGLSETGRRVVEVWRGVLKHGDIRTDSSFFEVGGTSLTVFAAVHRLREAFGLDRSRLSDQVIYQFPTVEALAAYIDGLTGGGAPVAAPVNAILVTLKKGDETGREPFFVVAPPGGTLGAYDKLAKVLGAGRDVVGLRDPYVWGDRDPGMGFDEWVDLYVGAIRERQPAGPYYVGAYSSAGAFGYEIARRLREKGDAVALLVLIDPLGIDSRVEGRFGYWAFRARFMRPAYARLIRFAGWLRRVVPGFIRDGGSGPQAAGALTEEEYRGLAAQATKNRVHIRGFSTLLELNAGLAFGLDPSDLAKAGPDGALALLLDRVRDLAPDVEPESIERMVIQYYLQTRAQHLYRLRRYDGKTVIFEPEGPYNGLLFAQFKPYVSDLRVVPLKLGTQSERTRTILTAFSEGVRAHYLSMRDDEFVRELARELVPLLG